MCLFNFKNISEYQSEVFYCINCLQAPHSVCVSAEVSSLGRGAGRCCSEYQHRRDFLPDPGRAFIEQIRLGVGEVCLKMNCSTNVVQVTNVSPSTTSEQMRTLFGFLGSIEELKLFPPE